MLKAGPDGPRGGPSLAMYSTCLFCNKSLGANQTFQAFPVGKRLAFDAAKGRLWVVCPQCERWNLTPLEERWETIESAERLYRESRRRVATDNVGLAKLRDGTEIVRIGTPLRPEFAAWRYGDQFGRRRRRQMIIAGSGVAAIAAVIAGGVAAGAGAGLGSYWTIASAMKAVVRGRPNTVIARVNTEHDGLVYVRRRHLGGSSLARADDGTLALDLAFDTSPRGRSARTTRRSRFEGPEAQRIASILVPKLNRFGGDKVAVARAVSEIEDANGPEAYLDRLSGLAPQYTGTRHLVNSRRGDRMTDGLFALPAQHRLALEMALHEEAERRALEGELAVLERAWREAEEIAGISDDLLTPPSVSASVERLRSGGRLEPGDAS